MHIARFYAPTHPVTHLARHIQLITELENPDILNYIYVQGFVIYYSLSWKYQPVIRILITYLYPSLTVQCQKKHCIIRTVNINTLVNQTNKLFGLIEIWTE